MNNDGISLLSVNKANLKSISKNKIMQAHGTLLIIMLTLSVNTKYDIAMNRKAHPHATASSGLPYYMRARVAGSASMEQQL